MESPLSFNATERFRKSLLIRNLPPYEDFKHEDLPGQSELTINDVGVMDPGNVEEIRQPIIIKLEMDKKPVAQVAEEVAIKIANAAAQPA